MTRSEVERTLMWMESCREQSYEAETLKEKRRLEREYTAMWKSIEPYILKKKPYSGELEVR